MAKLNHGMKKQIMQVKKIAVEVAITPNYFEHLIVSKKQALSVLDDMNAYDMPAELTDTKYGYHLLHYSPDY